MRYPRASRYVEDERSPQVTIRTEVDANITDAKNAAQAGDPAMADPVLSTIFRTLADQVDDLHARVSRLEDRNAITDADGGAPALGTPTEAARRRGRGKLASRLARG